MKRRTVLPVLLGVVLLGAVPALADENDSTEQQQVRRACSAPADPHYSAPKSGDCKKTSKGKYKGDGKYAATYYTNDVKCGEKNSQAPANPTGIRVYGSGDTSPSGGLGICSDGSGAAPAQGRVGVKGSASSGMTITVDGDKDNGGIAEQATGYAVIKAGPGGVSAGCGKGYGTGGNGDSDSASDVDQANCG